MDREPPPTKSPDTGSGEPSLSSPSISTDNTSRIKASIENWKRKLLDLSKRNRALNFKVNKVSTITIVDEQPAEVFRQLYLKEQNMRFRAAPEDAPQKSNTRNELEPDAEPRLVWSVTPPNSTEEFFEAGGGSLDEEDDALHNDFVPYDASSLDDRYTDDWLLTTSQPEALDKSLRRLDEQARLSLEEQGVNPLFLAIGMLHYTESSDSELVFRAPLVLLPVELNRKSARSGYQLRATDEDPLVNPALAEYLKSYSIVLPELPDANSISDDYDLQSLLSTVAERIENKKSWAVKTDIYLGLFSFQKFVMYKDLQTNADQFGLHRLIQQLVLRSGSQVVGLPGDVRSMELDLEFPPETTFQVVDADSSQLRAIAACARNYDLVIEGPPGTGKSQTITNLIAQALAADKSVLFVAEKMAALEVVHRRIVQAGLGEACLELHSTKANKRAVMKELAASLDASLQSIAAPTISTQRLPQVRNTLSEYVTAVHDPFGTLAMSPYRAYGELGRVLNAPRASYSGPANKVTFDQLNQTVRDLQDLTATSAPIGIPSEHAWRDSTRTFYSEDDLENIRALAHRLSEQITTILSSATLASKNFGLPELRTFQDIDTATAIASVMERSPGAPVEVLSNEAWNRPPDDAAQLITRGRQLDSLKAHVGGCFTTAAIEQDHATDIEYVEQKSQGVFSFLSFFDSRYRSIKKRWVSYRASSFQGSMIDQANEMKQVDQLRAERIAINEAREMGHSLFGPLWQGEHSSWDVLDKYVQWVLEFRGLCVKHGLAGRIVEVASNPAPDISDVHALQEQTTAAREQLQMLRKRVGWPDTYLEETALEEIRNRADRILKNIAQAPQWAAFETARVAVHDGLAGELLPAVFSGELSFQDMSSAFLRTFYMKWLSLVVQERPPLAKFNTLTHEQRVQEFKQLDERVLLENRAALVSTLRDRVQHRLQQKEISESLPYLRKEIARQRRHAPLRRTMKLAGAAIRAIKPCFMMSPLTVAQLVEGSLPSFDLVIFDEASQLPPEDAVGAVARAKQLVVVGDPKQLPPTNFFLVSSGQVNAPIGEDGTPIYEDSESILEDFMAAGAPQSRLKWHYRSTHESLINFSNVSFYDADLYTFPSVETGTEHGGLQFEYVNNGVYEGKGLNQVEANRVAEAVVSFAKEQLQRQEHGERMETLGVGTFNLRQQLAIQDELEKRRREEPEIESFFARGVLEPFFVKNLENIQGDERDYIFLSVTYAKATDGKLRYNFGPLNSENGWRRLNVLTTRARHCMRVFSSIRGDEINPAATVSNGPRLLREFLSYAEHGRLDSTIASAKADTDSLLEQDVLTELSQRGVTVVPQVGVAGYRIDLGVLDDVTPGRFLCGIECDGVAYHSSETARDRDRLRQQVLEARGWTIHRVWSTDWFKDRQGQIQRLLSLIETARSRAADEAASEREARERLAMQVAEQFAAEAELRKQEAEQIRATALTGEPYQRPVAASYASTSGEGRYVTSNIFDVPLSDLVKVVVLVVETESPIHKVDLFTRVAAMWGLRAGSRIQALILTACESAERGGITRRRGDFYWSASSDQKCPLRSRSGTKIPADRIADEEYQEAICAVLSEGHAFSLDHLTSEVRGVFGFSRTGPVLETTIKRVIEGLLRDGKLGEGSTGIRLRK
jgi:very-short-patch-repair endonuclease